MLTTADTRRKSKKELTCSHCGKKGHSKERCYRIIGFLEDFKFTKGKNNVKRGKGAVNNVSAGSDLSADEIHMEQEEGLGGTSTMSQMCNLQHQVNKLMEILSENGLTSNEGHTLMDCDWGS
ncbi:Uncharacterized protein TCM_046349 [Theobroma cacao]|uniref:CCHC-type domain-containing protein n=1 Tax=Theobroma cacao TaxID=3641 RepID=S1SIM3_THECC|nr:Uncharacterized protein TCM_046349 [Theobroma cacao]